jgi:hypothetical protein
MRWINKLSDTDIENLVKKLGVEYESLKIVKRNDSFIVSKNNETSYVLFFDDFQVIFNFDRVDDYNYRSVDKIFYLFMENKFGREYLIDLIRNKTGLSGKFLRKKLK